VTLAHLGVPEGARVTSLLAFVAGALGGVRAPVVHVTDAAAWGMYDLRADQWSEATLDLVGLDTVDMPDVTWELAPVGARAGVPVMCAIADQQASLLGAGLGEGVPQVSVNLATGCQVSVVSDSIASPAQTRPYLPARGRRRYLHTVTHLPAGRLLTAAVLEARGSTDRADWQWAVGSVGSDSRVGAAVDTIVAAIVAAVDRLGARGLPVRFSGGLVQQFAPIRDRLLQELAVAGSVFPGDDASLAGLGRLVAGSRATGRIP
jgi:sugar (pentulose or hexulose) kinase